jgi:hypothetical protein
MITHDFETSKGRDFCGQLMDLDESFGIKASFQIVPETRYAVSQEFLESIRRRGFEVNVHDLNHDGHLFKDKETFTRRAAQINSYVRQFRAQGFRSAVLYRNADWHSALDVSYDMSIPSVAHMDPQSGGCCSVLPFSVGAILELPVTTTQDYSLFFILRDFSIDLWKEQVSRILRKHGLISMIAHPDYLIAKTARKTYAEFLAYLRNLRSQKKVWTALPAEVASWWRVRSALQLVNAEGRWRIEGQGCERARLAYAVAAGDTLAYEFDDNE